MQTCKSELRVKLVFAILMGTFNFRLIENEQPQKQRKDDDVMEWKEYHRLETIYEWLDTIKAVFPEFVTIETIGESYERRPIKLVKLSKKQVIAITFNCFLIFTTVAFIAEQSSYFYRGKHSRARVDCVSDSDLDLERIP